MSKNEPWFIYILIDPRTEEIRYVGWTFNTHKRLNAHISNAKRTKSHKAYWIKSLLDIKERPLLKIIETGNGDGWQQAERQWISHYRFLGAPLTNATDGGDGTPGFIPGEETRKKMSLAHAGRKQSPESIAKTRAALLGRKQSPEHVAALSAARKGKIPIAAMYAARKVNLGRKQSDAHIDKRITPLIGSIRISKRSLTNDQVRLVRSTVGKISIRKMALSLGVGQTIIHEIRHRTAYREVQD